MDKTTFVTLVSSALQRFDAGFPFTPEDPSCNGIQSQNNLANALGWLAGSVVVGQRFLDSAIDVIPANHPESGWDRFLITRRVSCILQSNDPPTAFGTIMLTGPDAPHIVNSSGETLLSLGPILSSNPEAAYDQILGVFPRAGLESGSHQACPHEYAAFYPSLYKLVAEMIINTPGISAARELFVDDKMEEGAYHPLYIHTGTYGVGLNYDWFAIELNESTVFVDITGNQIVYRTSKGTWASPGLRISAEQPEIAKQWLLQQLQVSSSG